MAALVLSVAVAGCWGQGFDRAYLYITGLAIVLSLLGVLDDVYELSARARMLAYALVTVVACCALWTGDLFSGGPALWMELALAVIAVLWAMNLYNFMDGIDGIAATQAILASGAAALLSWQYHGESSYVLFCSLFALCHLGFLLWNWQPARLFMGDAGSVPSGFILAILAFYGHWQNLLPLGCWLILTGVFVVDATYTLVWRFADGQNIVEAHSLHAYQRLSRHWRSHRAVVVLMIGIVVLWLFPLAALALIWPKYQVALVILAYVPLVMGMLKLR